MLKKIFSIIIFSSVILLIPISSPKALSIPNIEGLYNTINNYVGSSSYYTGPKMCKNGTLVVYDGSNYYAFCLYSSGASNFFGATSNITSVDNNYLNRSSNYYNLTDLYYFVSGQQIKRYPLYRFNYDSVNDLWSYSCSTSTQPYCDSGSYLPLNSDSVILGFLDFFPNLTTTFGHFYLNFNENITLFNKGYNIQNYFSVLNNWQESSYTQLNQPDLVVGSHETFESDDLTSVPSYSYGNYSNYNNYVYTIDDIDTDYALLGASFNYNYHSDNNYKLGFVVTYRKTTDTPILVYAQTNEGTYACNVTSVMAKNDITYQWYVECPSVDISNDESMGYLNIRVEGAYDTTSVVGPRPIWDTNDLFYTDTGVVGISPIVKSVTSEPPTPVGPPEPTPDIDIVDSIDNINNTITDETLPNTSVLSNSAGWLPPGPVDSIINMPLSLFGGLLNIFSSNDTCQPVNVPLPYLSDQSFQLPCFSTLISSMGFGVWFEGIGAIAAAYILYHYLINLYAWVDKTLTFRENNWQDWGGI